MNHIELTPSHAETHAMNDSQRRLTEQHIAYATNIAKKYYALARASNIEPDDIRQEALLGLCEAALRYDETMGTDFKSYAYLWCRKYIAMALRNNALKPNEDIDVEEIDIIDNTTERQAEQEHNARLLRSRMQCLTQREQRIACMLNGIGQAQQSAEETARELHLSTAHVKHIYQKAIKKMR